MKEKLKNKKVVYTIIGIVSVLLVALAVTYAYWLVTKTQTNENEITAGCLDITISDEKNDIELTNQFPMSDEDGMKLVPYEFAVTNNCNTSVDYQVSLEAIGDSSNALSGTSLKVALNNNAKIYSAYSSVETTIDGAYESRVLGYSRLAATGSEGSSDTYSLRIWIDEDAPISEMNKTFKSKISVTIGQGIESPYEEGTLAYSILSNVGGTGVVSEIDTTGKHEIIATRRQYVSTSSNYYYGTEYTYDETTGKYTLSGTKKTAIIGRTAYNTNYDNAKYVGYTYEGTNEAGEMVQVDSTIKGVLDTWYDTHLEEKYGDKIADSIFCNDRSEVSYTYYDADWNTITDPSSAVYKEIYYGADKRLKNVKAPSLRCANQSDRYTVDDTTNGNGLLKNPVGLITADEEVLAGASSGITNTSYYLYNGDYYWTSSPSVWSFNCEGLAHVWLLDNGVIYYDSYNCESVDYESGVRPVINLKADVKFTGDGAIDNPYVIVTE